MCGQWRASASARVDAARAAEPAFDVEPAQLTQAAKHALDGLVGDAGEAAEQQCV